VTITTPIRPVFSRRPSRRVVVRDALGDLSDLQRRKERRTDVE
jgi:hypothetical protein